jgi:hypothetical protein
MNFKLLNVMFSDLFRGGLLASLLLLSACASIGPATINRDRVDYGTSMHESVKRELLGNIVGLRYLEAPIFVEISSVINQYALSGTVAAGFGVNNSFTGGNASSLGANGTWEDRPTITYSPITGKKFAESLLTPVQPESLFALIQSGWPTDLMFRLTVSSINGVEDASGGKQANAGFRELMVVWQRLRDARVIGLRRSAGGDAAKAKIVLYVNDSKTSVQTTEDLLLLRETLKLDPAVTEYTLSYGLVPDEANEIAVLTQSILDSMLDLARQVDVPPEHVEEGRTLATFVDEGLGGSMFKVHYSLEEPDPDDVYTSVYNRGYWFYIDDRDMLTKRTFGVLQIILSLTDSGSGSRGPVVSIGG